METAPRMTTEFVIARESCVGCLECQLRCSLVHQRVFNPHLANIRVTPSANGHPYYDITYLDSCMNCGCCVRVCDFGALTFASSKPAGPEMG